MNYRLSEWGLQNYSDYGYKVQNKMATHINTKKQKNQAKKEKQRIMSYHVYMGQKYKEQRKMTLKFKKLAELN